MRIAVPVYHGRVAPVFDVSQKLTLFDVENSEIVRHQEEDFSAEYFPAKISLLISQAANVLICGAVSWPALRMIEGAGIRVIPNVSGSAEEVVEAFVAGRLPQPDFMMPGCCGRRRRRRGQRRSRRHL